MRSPIGVIIFIAIMLILDSYVFQAVKAVVQNTGPKTKTIVYTIYWSITALAIIGFLLFVFTEQNFLGKKSAYLFICHDNRVVPWETYRAYLFLVDDVRRGIQWVAGKLLFSNTEGENMGSNGISRSVFLSWLGIAAGTTLFGSLLYGFGNKYNYTLKRLQLTFNSLPGAFKGLKIVHISDIHCGSFTDIHSVQHGVQMILNEKPDVIFFTGDLVNDKSTEMNPFMDVFRKVTAPMGVYSTLGNHDYGDYVSWPINGTTKTQNLENLKKVHKALGWKLMMNEHIILEKSNEQIAVLGVENWSTKSRFPKYGSLSQAYSGSEKYPFKILLSHDPSHWEGEVLVNYKDIDLVLSGHTHGMQFGVEIPGFKWSPVQYIYKQWAGLYEDAHQKLYVNRGFGFIGYPGRVGILPEITVIELV